MSKPPRTKLDHYEQAVFILICGILITLIGATLTMFAICSHHG
jgi:hypothetical protein